MKTIILADDEFHVRSVIAHKLTRAGYTVLTAADGVEALSAAREHRPDLLITDMQMPRMDGLALCRALAADAGTAAVPIIMVTSREFEIGPEQTRGTSVAHVMSKPFSPSALVNQVRVVLEGWPDGSPANSASCLT